jgi:hypothetical protein
MAPGSKTQNEHHVRLDKLTLVNNRIGRQFGAVVNRIWPRAASYSPGPIISSPAATQLTAVERAANDR